MLNIFYWCTGLTSITIPNSVTSIGDFAFQNCSSLSSVISKIETPFAFGISAFYKIASNCTLTVPIGTKDAYIVAGWKESVFKGGIIEKASPPITFADATVKDRCVVYWDTDGDGELSESEAAAVTDIGYVFNSKDITTFNELRYFTGITSIGENDALGAFAGCSKLTSVIIPNNVTRIGKAAFRECSKLASINIPSSVVTIDDYAFESSGLTSVTIPSSVTTIGTYAFSGCRSLTSIVVESGNTVYDSRENCNAIIETASNTLISGCRNTIIPNSVTSIYSQAFYQCTALNSLDIPTSVKSIGQWAFYGCNGLTSLVIPNNVETIGTYAFQDCTYLTSVTISGSITSIGGNAFQGCSRLTSISFPNGVHSIGSQAFYQTGWYNNQSNGLLYLNNWLLGFKVTMPTGTLIIAEGTQGIANAAFSGCYGLNSVSIPNSVTSIGHYAFHYCSGFTFITIPNSVTSIGYLAFGDCSKLSSVISEIETPFAFDSSFSGISPNCTLTVPAGTKAAYIAAGWTENVFKGGIIDPSCTEQTLEFASIPAMTYGDSAYTLPQNTTEGLTLTWSINNSAVASISGNTLTIVGAGTATVTATQAGNDNYLPFEREFTLTVNKATLTITANDCSKQEGEENPELTVSYSGFKYNDDAATLTTQPTVTTTATKDSPAGAYPITVSGAASGNYTFNYVAGTLTVTEAPTEIVVTDISQLDNVVYIENTDAYLGNKVTLSVKMKNAEAIQTIQFDFYLPESTTVVANEDGELITASKERVRKFNYFESTAQADGALRLLAQATTTNVPAGDGEICTITLNIPDNMAEGEYPLIIKNTLLVEQDNTSHSPDPNLVQPKLIVNSYIPGDANNDGEINAIDFNMIGNHILGHSQSGFNVQAADLNGDGEVNAIDFNMVANIILNGNGAAARMAEADEVKDPA